MKRVLLSIFFIVAASAVASAQSFTYYFPQIVSGANWRTTIFVSNASAAGTSTGSITFTKADGTPFAANWTDEMGANATGGGNTISFSLASGSSRKYSAVGDMPLTVGYAMVTASDTPARKP